MSIIKACTMAVDYYVIITICYAGNLIRRYMSPYIVLLQAYKKLKYVQEGNLHPRGIPKKI